MIYGLGAAIGWGFADLWAALSGRRIGALPTLVITQLTTTAIASAVVAGSGTSLTTLRPILGWIVPNAFLTAAAYYTLYRGLALGPVAVVSPLLATYGVVPVGLSVLLLGESLAPLTAIGIAVTIAGAVLASSDLRVIDKVRARAPGLRWALAATALFGLSTYVFGWSAQQAGWLPALWFSRAAMSAIFVSAAVIARARRARRGEADGTVDAERDVPSARAVAFAAMLGFADLLGSMSYSRGAALGFISIVTAASATYPVVPVLGGVAFLRERPAPNQYLGIVLVIAGLLAVGFG